jgi:sec-independent protein translocase protein TatA
MLPGWFGPTEILILLLVVLLVFGPKRLPQLGRSLGHGLREFKDGITGRGKDRERTALPEGD